LILGLEEAVFFMPVQDQEWVGRRKQCPASC
jgi:hypothetical protein